MSPPKTAGGAVFGDFVRLLKVPPEVDPIHGVVLGRVARIGVKCAHPRQYDERLYISSRPGWLVGLRRDEWCWATQEEYDAWVAENADTKAHETPSETKTTP